MYTSTTKWEEPFDFPWDPIVGNFMILTNFYCHFLQQQKKHLQNNKNKKWISFIHLFLCCISSWLNSMKQDLNTWQKVYYFSTEFHNKQERDIIEIMKNGIGVLRSDVPAHFKFHSLKFITVKTVEKQKKKTRKIVSVCCAESNFDVSLFFSLMPKWRFFMTVLLCSF